MTLVGLALLTAYLTAVAAAAAWAWRKFRRRHVPGRPVDGAPLKRRERRQWKAIVRNRSLEVPEPERWWPFNHSDKEEQP